MKRKVIRSPVRHKQDAQWRNFYSDHVRSTRCGLLFIDEEEKLKRVERRWSATTCRNCLRVGKRLRRSP